MAAPVPALGELLTSTKHLLEQFASSLSSPPRSATTNDSDAQLDPLPILRDAAALLKAHTTKLGLLLLNKPFTPSAVAKVLAEASRTCLPAMMSAVELLGPRYGAAVGSEVRGAVGQVVGAVLELRKDIASVAESPGRQDLRRQSDSTLASTGQVWAACDGVAELAALGPAGIVCRRAEEHRQLLRDAIEELKEFGTLDDEGYDDDEVSDQDSDVHFGPSKIPASRPELLAQVQASVKKLGLLDVGMKAIAKRRLKLFPTPKTGAKDKAVEQLDIVMSCMKQLPEEVDELAGKFYEFDETGAETQLQTCVATLTKAAELVKDGWAGASPGTAEANPFPEWVDKWKVALQQ